MTPTSEAEHILELSRELLDDIELDRLPSDKLLLKCSRLARLSGPDEIRSWISFEMQGYNSADPISLAYMGRTGRWVDYEKKTGYWGPLAQQESIIASSGAMIEATKISGGLSGDSVVGAIRITQQHHANLAKQINQLSGVKSRVLALLHTFVAGVYYERQFAKIAETTFESYKREIDALIATHAGDVMTKIPSVIARLQERNKEGISQALATCRRIIEAFADAIYPPSNETYELNGNALTLDASKHQNRINVYIAERITSKSRRNRLRQNITNLYDRVSTAVHNDVTVEEAYSLFLNVYLFLGEVLHLAPPAKSDHHVDDQEDAETSSA